jgi:hypothetical protein
VAKVALDVMRALNCILRMLAEVLEGLTWRKLDLAAFGNEDETIDADEESLVGSKYFFILGSLPTNILS